MIESRSFLDVIASIYAAPGSRPGWDSVMAVSADLVGAKCSAYFLVDSDSHENRGAAQHGYTEEDTLRYQGMGGRDSDIRFQHIDNLVPGEVFREFEYVPDKAAYAASEWIQYELRTHGNFYNMIAHISTHRLWFDIVSFNRLQSKGIFPDSAKADLRRLLPHFSRGAELHRTVQRLEAMYGAVLAVLDKLLIGLVILDTRGRMILTNAAAKQAITDTGAMKLASNSRLQAVNTNANAELQRLIAAAADTIQATGTSDGGQLVVPGSTPGARLLIDIMPIRDDGLPDGDNIRGVAVFIVDPNRAHVLNTEALSKIFSLSPAEGNIANALINGAKPNEIAEERRTSSETVRSQIKSIYRKTGAGSEGDLVRLAAKADPPIERG